MGVELAVLPGRTQQVDRTTRGRYRYDDTSLAITTFNNIEKGKVLQFAVMNGDDHIQLTKQQVAEVANVINQWLIEHGG